MSRCGLCGSTFPAEYFHECGTPRGERSDER